MNFSRAAARLTLIVLCLLLAVSCAPKTAPPPVPAQPRPARIALVLGAGAARGFAHIGVLKVLEENHIPISMIVGTSAGSLVGSLFAYGYSPYQLEKLAISIKKDELVDLTIPSGGFIRGRKLEDFVNRCVRNTPMEKLKIPFYAVATDIQSGREVVFGRGNTGEAVRASCSIPGIFQPAPIGGRLYVDGGVASPLPVEEARRYGADMVIAVDISADLDTSRPSGIMDVVFKTVGIMYGELEKAEASKADILIRPRVGDIGSSDFSKRYDAILEGERAAEQAMPAIKAKINQLREAGRLPLYSSAGR